MARPKLGETETARMQLKITAAEIKAIDDWRFENRVPSRSEAVRRLCQIGVQTSKAAPALHRSSTLAMAEMTLLIGMITEIVRKNPDLTAAIELKLAMEKHGKNAMLHSAQTTTEVGELTNHAYHLTKEPAVEEAILTVSRNILRRGEVDLLTVDYVKEIIRSFS